MKDYPATDPVRTPVGSPYVLGGSCEQSASRDRCQALAFAAAGQLGVPFDGVRSLDVVPNPSPDGIDFAHRTFLEVTLWDGTRQPVVISCPGIAAAYAPPCMSAPVVGLGYPRGTEGGGGYTDLPGNPTPFPALDSVAVKEARPLLIDELLIPITRTGRQAIAVGKALLPNGFLAEGQFGLSDPWPSDVLFDGGIVLEIRPTAGGEPLMNLYEHGWREGVEEVEATITFVVAWFQPGASIKVVHLVVR